MMLSRDANAMRVRRATIDAHFQPSPISTALSHYFFKEAVKSLLTKQNHEKYHRITKEKIENVHEHRKQMSQK